MIPKQLTLSNFTGYDDDFWTVEEFIDLDDAPDDDYIRLAETLSGDVRHENPDSRLIEVLALYPELHLVPWLANGVELDKARIRAGMMRYLLKLRVSSPVYPRIDDVPNKRADTLQHLAPTDPYNCAIIEGAKALIGGGHFGWEYVTQWAGGSTCWRNPTDDYRVVYDPKTKSVKG